VAGAQITLAEGPAEDGSLLAEGHTLPKELEAAWSGNPGVVRMAGQPPLLLHLLSGDNGHIQDRAAG
jgi:hypothetical protein